MKSKPLELFDELMIKVNKLSMTKKERSDIAYLEDYCRTEMLKQKLCDPFVCAHGEVKGEGFEIPKQI